MGIFDKFFKRAKTNEKANKTKEKIKTQGKVTPSRGKMQPKSAITEPTRPSSLSSSTNLPSQVTGQVRKSTARSDTCIDLDRDLATPHLVPSSLVTSVYKKTYDCVAFLIHCPVHSKIGVAMSPTEAIWLPYVQKPDKISWYESAREGAMQVLAEGSTTKFEVFRRNPPFDQILLLEVARVQMPSTNKFIGRFTFYVRLKPSTESDKQRESSAPGDKKLGTSRNRQFDCCVDTARLRWLSLDFICEGYIRNCWGPEVVDLGRQVVQAIKLAAEQASQTSTPAPFIFQQRLLEQSAEQLFEILPRMDGPVESNSHTESLKKITTRKNDIERLFDDFLDHCYPSFYMTYDSFRHYLRRNGFENSEVRLKRFFRTFNRASNGYLSFNELLLGLISMERETPHVEFRIRFVFNYYDTKSRGVLLEEDFKKMVRDMNTDKHGKIKCSESQIQRMVDQALACFKTKTVQSSPAVTFSSFLNGIGSHAFRGTSGLCRSKRNVFTNIARRIAARTVKTSVAKGILANVVTKKNYQGSCESCKARKYKVASHVSIITLNGYCSDQVEVIDMPQEALEQLPPESDSAQRISEATLSELSLNFVTEPPRTESVDAALLMARIRKFNEVKPRFAPNPGQPMHGLMTAPEERDELLRLVKTLADEIIPLLTNEPRCKPVSSPSFIIGDIHGNLEDLMSLERTIWRRFPELNGMHYLFLGDYVDRGRWSVECALYLFAMKLLRPKNVTLLRGNHEVRDIQNKYTYRKECLVKYGEHHGKEVWNLTNRIFDHMPLCAVVDNSVFCAHGGIPHTAHTIDEIACQVDLVDPEHESEVAWEIMWSDPILPEHFRQAASMIDSELVASLRPGYIFNQKRGTAFYFNDVATNDFLADNQLSHIIRAHEVPKLGFVFHFDFKCATIFSCSHYCGNDNESAVVLIDAPASSMRAIRIDTTNNVSATE